TYLSRTADSTLLPTPINPLPLHDALPIYLLNFAFTFGNDLAGLESDELTKLMFQLAQRISEAANSIATDRAGRYCSPPRKCAARSEEHTSELQSHLNLVCRLLREKKNMR